MRRQLLLGVFIISSFITLLAQDNTKIWYFGLNAGIDFRGTNASALTNGALYTSEGCAIICDTSYNLLFYTDGRTIYNKNHTAMQNGTNLLGHISSTQSSIVVQQPQNDSLYYVFTVDFENASDGINYNIVNSRANSGLGSVVNKNVSLVDTTCEKITAVSHANGSDYWIVTRLFNSNTYHSYLLSDTGLCTTPVVTSIGMTIQGNVKRAIGYMKPSHDGNRLAVGHNFTDSLEVFDFDRTTGELSNLITLTNFTSAGVYGLEFSPNSNLLYASTEVGSGVIYQYNLLAGIQDSIQSQRVLLNVGGTTGIAGAMQLAPDGKIYVARWYQTSIGVINSPDSIGTACNYNPTGFYLGRFSMGGLPNIGVYAPPLSSGSTNTASLTAQNGCIYDSTAITLTTNYGDSVKYYLNSTLLGTQPGSYTFTTPITQSGVSIARAIIFSGSDRDTLEEAIQGYYYPSLNAFNDSSICSGDSIILTANYTADSLLWSNNDTSTTQVFSDEGWKWATATTVCGSLTDSFYLNVDSINFNLGPDVTACLGNSVVLNPATTLDSIRWSNHEASIIANTSGEYVAIAYNGVCIASDSQVVTFDSIDFELGPPVTACLGETVSLSSSQAMDSVRWLNNQSSLSVTAAGTYIATAYNGVCTAVDSQEVYFDTINFELGAPITACSGETVTLSSNQNFDSLKWSNNQPTLAVTQPGTYTATAYHGVCSATDAKIVSFDTINFELGPPIFSCNGSTVTLSSLQPLDSVRWSNNESTIQVNQSGLYSATGYSGTCIAQDAKQVFFDSINFDLGPAIHACAGQKIVLNSNQSMDSIRWSNNKSELNVSTSGTYTAIAYLGACAAIDSQEVIFDTIDLELGPPIHACNGETIELTCTQAYDSFHWPNMQPNILITNSGTYSAVAYLGACVATDDKKVVFDQINFELEPTITACAGDQIELSSNANVDSVRWSNNESSMVVNQSGNYMATAYNGACVATDYQDVVFNSIDFTLGGDLQGCEGDFLELQADASYDSIKWNTGEASFAITATESGEYSATVYEGLCEASDSIQLVFYAQPTIDLGNNLERCENDPIQTIYLDDAYNYEWHDGSNSSYFDIVEPGLISVVAENNGCFNSDSLLVLQSNNCDCSVFIPSAFTPNNNSNNEVFKAVSNGCNVSQYKLTVYNRWGEKLFESNSIEHGWDGTYKDAEAQQGVYLFMLQHHMSGKNTYRSGTVTLLR